MTDHQDFNSRIVEEFRANAGVVGGPFAGVPIVLVHHVGRKSGTARINSCNFRVAILPPPTTTTFRLLMSTIIGYIRHPPTVP